MKISVVATGGTISSEASANGLQTQGRSARDVLGSLVNSRPAGFPEVTFSVRSPFTLLSENFIPRDWGILARAIQREVDQGADAVIVTHGTDTMAYSIAAVSLLVPNVSVPVVFTGAMHPIDAHGSDAHGNFWSAVLFAFKTVKAGVYLCFADARSRLRRVYWGPLVRNMRTYNTAFESADHSCVAEISGDQINFRSDPSTTVRTHSRRQSEGDLDVRMEEAVCVLEMFPGFKADLIRKIPTLGLNYKVILLDLFHSGTGCTRNGSDFGYSLVQPVEEVTKRGILVLGVAEPQVKEDRRKYKTTNILVGAGLKILDGITLEVAYVKTLILLGRGISIQSLEEEIEKPWVGEVVARS